MTVGASQEVEREALAAQFQARLSENDQWIRERVLRDGRIDILAREVLGYEVTRFHLSLMVFMAQHRESLQLAFRGGGKSTVLTVCGAILDMLQDPDVRVCIASKTEGHAAGVLSEIKAHLEANEKFRRVFGDLVTGATKWNETEVTIGTRVRPRKEPTIFAVGIEGQVVGKHFDRVYCDDLVDEKNTRTSLMRERTKTWYYVQLHPTMEPHCHLHVIGTRYHYDDLYGHLEANEMKTHTQVVPALDAHGRSPWPEKFPPSFFQDKRNKLGLIMFSSQFLCNTEAMKGEIFQYDWMQWADEMPEEVMGFAGVDLAIGQKEINDLFAEVGIGVTRTGDIYIGYSFAKHLRFSAQTRHIRDRWRDGMGGMFAGGEEDNTRLVEVGIETVAYQDAQAQTLEEEEPGLRFVRVNTRVDKVTRAMKLATRFEQGRVWFVGPHHALVESLVLFPNGLDDLFDALDIAVTTAFRPRRESRRRRDRPVGVI